MSGIAGLVAIDGPPVTLQLLDAMAAASAARAIDGVARWSDATAGLIRFKHATTPEAASERQPAPSPDGAIVVCFDGRLDNRAELLAMLGAPATAIPDCALVERLFALRGEALTGYLVGDWAFAIWEPRRRRLFCARAAMGWRPFLWTIDRERFAFATEPSTLVIGLAMARTPNQGAIAELLAGRFVTERETLWTGIQRLPQGSALMLENGRLREWRWFVGPFPDQSALSHDEQVERFSTLFDQAVAASARSNTSVAAQLSGGLDSSSVVCRAVALQRSGRIDRTVTAFSARFPGEAQDETPWSSAVEAKLGIRARVMAAENYELDGAARWVGETLQLPVRPNIFDVAVPTLRVASAEGCRVVLTGEGGDEWLGGWLGHLADLARGGDIAGLWHTVRLQFLDAPWIKQLRYAATCGVLPLVNARHRANFLHPSVRPGTTIPPWIRPDWARQTKLRERWIDARDGYGLASFAQRQRYSVYANSMRHVAFEGIQAMAERLGIEIRHPFHDLRLTRFVMGVPGSMLRRGGVRKYLLREAMRGSLPEEVRTRSDKTVFGSAIARAVLQYFDQHPPEAMRLSAFGWIDPAALRSPLDALSRWRSDPAHAPLPRELGSLWIIVAVEMWLEHAVRL